MLERLGERNSETLEWVYRKIRNYGPKDQGYLDSDDLDMMLEVATWVADTRKAKGQSGTSEDGSAVGADGVVRSTISTDKASWDAMVKAIERGATPDEALFALDNAQSTEIQDKAEAERLMRELLGGSYKPA